MTADEAKKRGVEPLARIVSWANAGVEPEIMGTGPIPATKKALEKAGWTVADLDLIESNEAFAAPVPLRGQGARPRRRQGERQRRRHRHRPPDRRVGRARVLTTLLHEMKARGARKGLATLCIGGGMGVALCVERP